MSGHEAGGHIVAERNLLWQNMNEESANRRSQNRLDHHRIVCSKSRLERMSCMQPVAMNRAMISMIGSMPNEKSTARRNHSLSFCLYRLSIS